MPPPLHPLVNLAYVMALAWPAVTIAFVQRQRRLPGSSIEVWRISPFVFLLEVTAIVLATYAAGMVVSSNGKYRGVTRAKVALAIAAIGIIIDSLFVSGTVDALGANFATSTETWSAITWRIVGPVFLFLAFSPWGRDGHVLPPWSREINGIGAYVRFPSLFMIAVTGIVLQVRSTRGLF